ncbi:MAG: winged helix-turn-helix transcriptional regulator [Deferribacterales bacterium]
MSIPSPGKPVRGSHSGAPIMAIFDLLGRSWAMGIIWNLNGHTLTFRELQERCESISPSILNTRLKDLRNADIVERTLDGYQLTERGRSLIQLLLPFGAWSLKWSEEVFGFTDHFAFKKKSDK